jgi:hypothetical protein
MAMMLGALYRALISAKVSEDDARTAAEEVAAYDQALSALRLEVRIGSAVLALNTAVLLGLVWAVVRLSEAVARLSP